MKGFLRNVARGAYRALLPRGAKNSLRLWLLLDEPDKPPQVIDDFSVGCVLVLAPHMDDEVIGCGGTIRKHVMAGAQATVVYMTDGRRGGPQFVGAGRDHRQEIEAPSALVERRKAEAQCGARILGIHETMFLDRADGELEADEPTVEALRRILLQTRPDVIYLPSVLDTHPDHWATNLVFSKAIGDAGMPDGWQPVCREYEVWTPLLPNRLVNITDVFDTKIEALKQHESQIAQVDYVHVTQGLNAYRSMNHLGGRGFAEAFAQRRPKEHRALLDRLVDDRMHTGEGH